MPNENEIQAQKPQGGAPKQEQKAEQSPKEEDKPKKKRKGLKWLIIIVLVLLIPLIALGATGLFDIPVVSHIFGTNKPIDLGIKTSPKAQASAEKKMLGNLDGTLDNYSILSNMEYSGQTTVEHQITSEEFASLVNQHAKQDAYIQDIQMKVNEGGMEISAHIVPYIDAPVYIKGNIRKASESSVDLVLDKIKVGRVPIPGNYLKEVEQFAEEVINGRMQETTGFSIDVLEFHAGYLDFKGTYPEKATVKSGNWRSF